MRVQGHRAPGETEESVLASTIQQSQRVRAVSGVPMKTSPNGAQRAGGGVLTHGRSETLTEAQPRPALHDLGPAASPGVRFPAKSAQS